MITMSPPSSPPSNKKIKNKHPGSANLTAATVAASDVFTSGTSQDNNVKTTNDKSNNSSDSNKKTRKPRFKPVEHEYPVEPRIIQVIKNPKTYMDHSYRDFSNVPPVTNGNDIGNGDISKMCIDSMSFAQKVYHILSVEEYSEWIHWLPHGRAFRIAVPKRLEQSKVIQKYFGHNRFSSFLRQLNNFGFKHITAGADRNCYYHECMLRGLPHLLKYMPPGRDSRRLIPDPDHEPDFYAISRLFPLPPNATTSTTVGSPTSTTTTLAPPALTAAAPSPRLPFISTQVQPVLSSTSLAPTCPSTPTAISSALSRNASAHDSRLSGVGGAGAWGTVAADAATNTSMMMNNTIPSTTTSQQMVLLAAFKKDPAFSDRYLSLCFGGSAAATTVAAMQQQHQPSSMALLQLQAQQQLQQQQYHDPVVLTALLGRGATTTTTTGTGVAGSLFSGMAAAPLPFGNRFQG
jgi:hypothetical protein